jgi:hypothetical protein
MFVVEAFEVNDRIFLLRQERAKKSGLNRSETTLFSFGGCRFDSARFQRFRCSARQSSRIWFSLVWSPNQNVFKPDRDYVGSSAAASCG